MSWPYPPVGLEAWTFPVMSALTEVWKRAPGGQVLYVRGSVARGPAGLVGSHPWDLDVVLVTEQRSPVGWTDTTADAVQRLYPTVPPLDLWRTTWDDLADESQLMTRVLLATDGACVLGHPPGHLQTPRLDRALGREVHPAIARTARLKAETLLERVGEAAEKHEVVGRCRSLAKAGLRLATGPALYEDARFLRAPEECAAWLNRRVHTVRADVHVLTAHLSQLARPAQLVASVRAVANAADGVILYE